MDNLLHLRNSIETLSKESQLEIFKILKDNNVDFSENKNGVFFNLSLINKNVIDKVQTHLRYIIKQEKIINDMEHKKHNVEEEYFTQLN